MTKRRTKSNLPKPVLTCIEPGNWRYDVEVAADDKFPAERYFKRGFPTRTDAREAAMDRHDARLWQRHSARKAAAGSNGGRKSHPKQSSAEAWAKRTRDLMNSGERFAEAADIAAEETGFKLAANYWTQHNQFRKAQQVPAPPETALEKSRRIRASMDRLKSRVSAALST